MDSASATSVPHLTEQKLVHAHDLMLKTRGLQFDFPTLKPEPPPQWLEPLVELLAALRPVFTWVFWGGLALAVVLVVWFVAREFGFAPGRRRPAVSLTGEEWRPEPRQARALLQDADRLAADGAFGEAVHLLLIRSIEDIVERRPSVIRPALTSRDIAGLAGIPSAAREAFALMAQTVEHSLFGGRPVSVEDFRRCRQQYEAFAFAGIWA